MLESEFTETAIRRCLALASPNAQSALADLPLSSFKVLSGQRLQAEVPADELCHWLDQADDLAPSLHYLLGARQMTLSNPGNRPVEMTIRPDTPDPEFNMNSLEVQHELAQIKLMYARCRAALYLVDQTIVILDRDLNYIESNVTLSRFGVEASDVIGRQVGEVPDLDWLVRRLAPAAFNKPQQPIIEDFEYSPLGFACRFRATAESYGDELMVSIQNLSFQPLLSRH